MQNITGYKKLPDKQNCVLYQKNWTAAHSGQTDQTRTGTWVSPQETVADMNRKGCAVYPTSIAYVRAECRNTAGKTKLVELTMEEYALLYQRTEQLLHRQAKRNRSLGL